MPAAGKTTLGKCLAKELRFQFLDLDHEIERQTGKTIAELFRQEGEARFRKIESEILSQHLKLENTVLATGGGTPCFHNNMQQIVDNSLCIYVLADLHEAAKRICEEGANDRPLFAQMIESEVYTKLEELYEIRHPHYAHAHVFLARGL